MAGPLTASMDGLRRALSSRIAKLLMQATLWLLWAYRGYVVFLTDSDWDSSGWAGAWLVVFGIYLVLQSTWWKQAKPDDCGMHGETGRQLSKSAQPPEVSNSDNL
ncbi:MAG: hypothetical protein ACR2MB_14640 [Acidimicrobiales bacterium]